MTAVEFFLCVLAMVESGNNPNAVGDLKLRNKAYGLYQIRKPYLDDVNRIYRKEVREKFGRRLTIKDVYGRGSEGTATWVVKAYLSHYGKLYTKKTGRNPTAMVYARIHNGGPHGWRKRSTWGYWLRFIREREQVKAMLCRSSQGQSSGKLLSRRATRSCLRQDG